MLTSRVGGCHLARLLVIYIPIGELDRCNSRRAGEDYPSEPKRAVFGRDPFRLINPFLLEGLSSIESLPQPYDIWIFSDGRSAIQHFANWHNVRDRTGTDILKILKRLSLSHQIHFQWIPSHVNIAGNEIADSLARAGAGETTTPAAPLTYLELFSKYKAKNKAIWMIPPVHPWYQSKCPGGSLVRGSGRRDQTELTRFLSGHLMSLIFIDGIKNFEIFIKCSAQASPGPILSWLGLTRQDLVQDPLLVLDFFRVNGLMDLI
ncbi:RNase H domain-containing protein [Trichonephila clavipes]|nr:RNase H domain-containing protein [Trichonephila clavipes]